MLYLRRANKCIYLVSKYNTFAIVIYVCTVNIIVYFTPVKNTVTHAIFAYIYQTKTKTKLISTWGCLFYNNELICPSGFTLL